MICTHCGHTPSVTPAPAGEPGLSPTPWQPDPVEPWKILDANGHVAAMIRPEANVGPGDQIVRDRVIDAMNKLHPAGPVSTPMALALAVIDDRWEEAPILADAVIEDHRARQRHGDGFMTRGELIEALREILECYEPAPGARAKGVVARTEALLARLGPENAPP